MEEKLVVDNQTMQGVLSKMFWIIYDGDGSDQRIQHKSALNATAEFSKEFSHPVGLSLWAMYQGIVVILLLNILIAMMNNTYMRIWANVDTEWKFAKTHFQVLLATSAKKSIKNTNIEQTYNIYSYRCSTWHQELSCHRPSGVSTTFD